MAGRDEVKCNTVGLPATLALVLLVLLLPVRLDAGVPLGVLQVPRPGDAQEVVQVARLVGQ